MTLVCSTVQHRCLRRVPTFVLRLPLELCVTTQVDVPPSPPSVSPQSEPKIFIFNRRVTSQFVYRLTEDFTPKSLVPLYQ